jgi:hypothetical protein
MLNMEHKTDLESSLCKYLKLPPKQSHQVVTHVVKILKRFQSEMVEKSAFLKLMILEMDVILLRKAQFVPQ